MARRHGLSQRQILGIILIIAAAIQYIPIIRGIGWLGVLATLIIGIFLLVK
ncbi:hypothetical protein KY363_07810 [Candidatus Woesearchaeota archaeon]|nr:hypothetical protein [Candidatus Woesearchaeota archaeon]